MAVFLNEFLYFYEIRQRRLDFEAFGDFPAYCGYHHPVEWNRITKRKYLFQYGQSNGIVTMYTVSKLSSSLSAGK